MLPATAKEDINYQTILDKIEKFRPKILNISGGEPALVPVLSGLMRRAKERFNPFIRIVHNGTSPAKLVSSFPWIDRFVVSLDGPGVYNTQTKGIDGTAVIRKLGEIIPEALRHKVEVAVNCVVTVKTAPAVSELADVIMNVSPHILLSLTPLMPPDSPNSILKHPQVLGEFLEQYRRLKAQGCNIIHTFDAVMRHPSYSCIQCYNQYFTIRVSPEGRISACPSNVPLKDALGGIKARKLFSMRGLLRGWAYLSRFAAGKTGSKIDFSCKNICNCESWMDMLFVEMESESIPVYARGLFNRMSDDDYLEMQAFVTKHVNPAFNIDKLRRVVDSSGKTGNSENPEKQ
jgi:MoaA/NifB/PqqE/SkfB family radical SAM enzyme